MNKGKKKCCLCNRLKDHTHYNQDTKERVCFDCQEESDAFWTRRAESRDYYHGLALDNKN